MAREDHYQVAEDDGYLGPPLSTLYSAAIDVFNHVLTQDEAIAAIRADSGLTVSKADVARAGQVALHWNTSCALPFSRLLLEATRIHGDRTVFSPWWFACDLFVLVTTRVLGDEPDGGWLRDAREVVDEQISLLRELCSYFPDSQAYKVELAETLCAAGDLLSGPFVQNFDPLDPDGSVRRWQFKEARLHALDNTRPKQIGQASPIPPVESLFADALTYFNAGADVADGHVRGLCLLGMVHVFKLLEILTPESKYHYERYRRDATEGAYRSLDRERAPVEYFDLAVDLTVLGRLPEGLLPSSVLPGTPDQFESLYGPDTALQLNMRILNSVHDPLWVEPASAEARRLAAALGGSHLYGYYEIAVHHFRGGLLDCSPQLAFSETLRHGLEDRLARGDASPRQVAATLAHAAAHAAVGQEDAAIAALQRVAAIAADFKTEHLQALSHLEVRLALRGSRVHSEAGRLFEACRICLTSIDAFMQLESGIDFALEAIELGLSAAGRADPSFPDQRMAVGLAFGITEKLLPTLLPGIRDGFDHYAPQIGASFDRLIEQHRMASITLNHHFLFKGNEFGILLASPGPRALARLTEYILNEIQEAERASGAYDPADDELLNPQQDSVRMLCYAGAYEAGAASSSVAKLANLRRAFDSLLMRAVMSEAAEQRLRRYGTVGSNPLLIHEIPPDTVLVSHYISEREDESGRTRVNLTTVIVTSDGTQEFSMRLNFESGIAVILHPSSGMTHKVHTMGFLVARLREMITADPLHRDVSRPALPLLVQESFKLGAPAPSLLRDWRERGKKHLCFWLHGPLHYVPLHLLHVDGRPLADDWIVTVMPSPVLLLRSSAEPRRPHMLVAVGAGDGGMPFGKARDSQVEQHVREVAARFPDGRADVLTGETATPRRLLDSARQATYLYIAAHGSHDVEAAWFQCLYLHPDPDNDGRLFAHDLLRTDLRGVELVGLGACETALGRFDRSDNLRGIPAALLMAGVRTVVGTLWPVAPTAATCFFGALFRELAAGVATLDAYRRAQLETRAGFPAYRDWGAFILMGDWR